MYPSLDAILENGPDGGLLSKSISDCFHDKKALRRELQGFMKDNKNQLFLVSDSLAVSLADSLGSGFVVDKYLEPT